MTTIELLNTNLESDPGVVRAGGKAINRPFAIDRWILDAGGDISNASWSYIDNRGPRSGFRRERSDWRFEFYMNFTAIPAGGLQKLIVGMHSTPPEDASTDPDVVIIVGLEFIPGSSLNTWKVQSLIYEDDGTKHGGGLSSEKSNLDLRIVCRYDRTVDEIRVRVYDRSSSATLYSSNFSTSGFSWDPLTVFGTRDNPDANASADMEGYMEDLLLFDWREVDEVLAENWVLLAEGEGVVLIENNGVWNKDQTQRETIVDALGRDWSSVYHDGAGPVFIEVSGILERDSCEDLNEIREFILDLKARGDIVTLFSPYKYFTIENALVDAWDMPNAVARILNRDFLLVVKSRRTPEDY